jgi:hypothetical protein
MLMMGMIAFASCHSQSNLVPKIDSREFAAKWYQGLAEITSYDLQQSRYGEMHPGEAVIIFVTEDFSKSKQVKLDNPENDEHDALTVLKMNAVRSFNTGVYQYNIMQSVFTPISYDKYPKTLKVTASSQDWCGHSWMQYNLKGKRYKATSYSYFESEGDNTFYLEDVFLEDEIWTKIRTAPHTLPTGLFQIIPGTIFSRMRHFDGNPVTATASINKSNQEYIYHLKYTELQRSLKIYFSLDFPYEISGWEETSRSGFGPNEKTLTTKAVLKKRKMLDYWRRNNLADRSLRRELGLSEY